MYETCLDKLRLTKECIQPIIALVEMKSRVIRLELSVNNSIKVYNTV